MPKNKLKAVKEKFYLSARRYMGVGAVTQELPVEEKVKINFFSDKKFAVNWIQNNGDKDLVYYIRDQKGKMIQAWCFRSKGYWSTINNDRYLGGYKIGRPHSPRRCSCCPIRYNDNKADHPVIAKPPE